MKHIDSRCRQACSTQHGGYECESRDPPKSVDLDAPEI